MAKKKYKTKYPKMVKKEAKKQELKVSKSDYRFLDCILHKLEKTYPELQVTVNDWLELTIGIPYNTNLDITVEISISVDCTCLISFTAHVSKLSNAAADLIGRQILRDEFSYGILDAKVYLLPEDGYTSLYMKEVLWPDSKQSVATREIFHYLDKFMWEIEYCSDALEDLGLVPIYRLNIIETGANRVKIIKAVREAGNLSLREAIDAVKQGPYGVLELKSEHDIRCIKDYIEELGGIADYTMYLDFNKKDSI